MLDTRGPNLPLIIGHRGAPGYRPEHTASSYRLAFLQGAQAVEPDIVVSRDGVLVIRHENEISTTTDVASRPEFAHLRTTKVVDGAQATGWFAEDFLWEELQTLRCDERVPELRPRSAMLDGEEPMLRLRDLLELIDDLAQPYQVVIELKHVHFLQTQGHDLVALLAAELHECGWADRPGRLIIECFEYGALERLAEAQRENERGPLAIDAQLVFLLETMGAPADQAALHGSNAKTYAWYRGEEGFDLIAERFDGVSVAKRDLLTDPELVQRAHERGLKIFTWTLRPENQFLQAEFRSAGGPATWGNWQAEWSRIIETGVDGIFVDHPDLVARLGQTAGESTEATSV